MFDAVLFDIGDVLVHFETWQARRFVDAGTRPVRERLIEWGYSPPPLGRYRRAMQLTFLKAYLWSRLRGREVPTLDIMRRLHARFGMTLDPARMGELARACVAPFRTLFTTDPLAVPVVSSLHRAGLKLAIVSNTFFPAFAIDDVLKDEGLLEYFPVRVYSSDVGYMKPHPMIFKIALDRLGVSPDRAIHVGDRVGKDVKGAKRAGIASVLLCKKTPSFWHWPRPDFLIRSLDELPAILGPKHRVAGDVVSTP